MPYTPPTPVALTIYPIPDTNAVAGDYVVIAGVPNKRIRIFQLGYKATAGSVIISDSSGNTYNRGGDSGNISGYMELPIGASLIATLSDNCKINAYVTAIIV